MQVFENDWMKRGGRFVPTMGKKSRTGFPMRLWVEGLGGWKPPPRLEDEAGALEAGFGDIFEWVFGADGEADAFEKSGGDRSQDGEWQ